MSLFSRFSPTETNPRAYCFMPTRSFKEFSCLYETRVPVLEFGTMIFSLRYYLVWMFSDERFELTNRVLGHVCFYLTAPNFRY